MWPTEFQVTAFSRAAQGGPEDIPAEFPDYYDCCLIYLILQTFLKGLCFRGYEDLSHSALKLLVFFVSCEVFCVCLVWGFVVVSGEGGLFVSDFQLISLLPFLLRTV